MTNLPQWSSWPQTMTLILSLPAFTFLICRYRNTTDSLLMAGFYIIRNRTDIFEFCKVHQKTLGLASGVISTSVALYCLFRILAPKPTSNKDIDDAVKPMFFPCGTTHTRLFPKKHSFSYSYLLTGFPIGWKGSVGGLLSVEAENLWNTKKGKDWFVVNAGEYLDRGHGQLGLEGKLHKYLQTQDIDPKEYPYAYLITVPKLLGYSFNPVSFWYLYSAQKELRAMILEVNNTFDERRPYFMKIDDSETDEELTQVEDDSASKANGHAKKPKKFTNVWPKDFHVSPFNSRKGFYSLIASDPLYPKMTGTGPIDNTITLLSSKQHPKLIARVFSNGAPIDPSSIDNFPSRMKFLADWWWIVYATAIRTIKEAITLYFKHGMHVWLRPEPLQTNMGRTADKTEIELEIFFRQWLRFLVYNCERPLKVVYTAAGMTDTTPEEFSSPSTAKEATSTDSIQTLEFKILTPVFYTRFIHYEDVFDALTSEFAESGTIWISDISIIKSLISSTALSISTTNEAQEQDMPSSLPKFTQLTNKFCINIINRLRHRPDTLTISQPGKPKSTISASTPSFTSLKTNLRPEAPITSMLYNPGGPLSDEGKTHFIRLISKICIMDLVAAGSSEVFWLEGFILRCVGAWAVAYFVSSKKGEWA